MYKKIFLIIMIVLLISTPIYALEWKAVNYSNPDLIKESGLTVDEFNNLSQSEWLKLLSDKEKVNFAFSATNEKGEDITDSVNPDLSIGVNGLLETKTVTFTPITEKTTEEETQVDYDTQTKINDMILEFDKVIYVDVNNGSDSVGIGTKDNPYSSISRGLQDLDNDNQALFIAGGTYNVKLTNRPASYNGREYSLFSTAPNVDYSVIGDPNNPPVLVGKNKEAINSFVSLKTEQVNKALSINLYNLILKDMVLFSDISNDYFHNISFNNCVYENNSARGFYFNVGRFYTINYYIEINNFLFNAKYFDYTNGSSSNITATNSVIFYDQKSQYNNSPTLNLNTTLINPNITYDTSYNLSGGIWKNAGTGENPDGSQANIGVYGGEYSW